MIFTVVSTYDCVTYVNTGLKFHAEVKVTDPLNDFEVKVTDLKILC